MAQDEEQHSSSHSPPPPHRMHQQQESHTQDAEATRTMQIEEGAELTPVAEVSKQESRGETSAAASPTQSPARTSILPPSLIIPFSILGLLIRLGLAWIETFSGQQIFALAWPQFIGCVLMGLFVSTRSWIEFGLFANGSSTKRHWIGPFVYVALSSGLCGSITTFSSWSLGMFVELINPAKLSRHPLQNILSALAELIATLAMSITGLQLGTHLGEAILPLLSKTSLTPIIPQSSQPNAAPKPAHPPAHWTAFDYIIIVSCTVLWIGMIIATVFIPEASISSWRHVTLATCFAPLGAILRWYLSRFNSRIKTFPVGTFAVNIGGSLILAAIVCLQHTPGAGGTSPLACQVLSGLQDGFCGCLTTISTFALELRTLPRRASYIYGVVSVVVAQLGMLIVLGTFVWTRRSTDMDDNVYQHSMCSG
ncbi:CrcB-like protein-domain-containing protein [Mortierella sp. GBAus27b]|nr:CrcB-like protein-domain-containing protein [Mortierella sp. GBAus27b]